MRSWNPWAGMTRRKLLMTLAFVVIFGACIGLAVHFMVEHSEPYELGRQAVGDKLNVTATSVRLKRLAEINFVEGDEHGHARFTLCATSGRCFKVVAKKQKALWKVIELREER